MTTAHPAPPERGFDIKLETEPDPETPDQVYDRDRKLMFLPMPKREIDPEEGIRWLAEDLTCWLQALVVGLRMEKEDEPLDKDLQSAFALLAIDITNAIHACTWAARKKETVVLDLEERSCIDFDNWTTVLAQLVAARGFSELEGGGRGWAFDELAHALVDRLNPKPEAEPEAEPEEDDENPIEERGDERGQTTSIASPEPGSDDPTAISLDPGAKLKTDKNFSSAVELHVLPVPKLQTRGDLFAALSEVIRWLDAAGNIVCVTEAGPASSILLEVQYILQVIDEGFRSNSIPRFRTYPLEDVVKVTDLIRAAQAIRDVQEPGDAGDPSITLLLELAQRVAKSKQEADDAR